MVGGPGVPQLCAGRRGVLLHRLYQFCGQFAGHSICASQQAAEGDAYRGYTAVLEENGVTAWRNPSAFPLAFCAAGDAAGVDFSQQNLFELQNELFCALTGETQPRF